MKSLNARLILYIALASLAVTLVGLTLSYYTARQDLLHQIDTRAQALADQIGYAFEGLIDQDKDFFSIQRIVEQTATLTDVSTVAVVDRTGQILAHNQKSLLSQRLEEPLLGVAINSERRVIDLSSTRLVIADPLQGKDYNFQEHSNIIGAIWIEMDLAELNNQLIQRYTWLVLLMIALVGLTSGAAVLIVKRLVMNRLLLLGQGMRQVETNNLDYRLPALAEPNRADELAQLMSNFNQMIEALQLRTRQKSLAEAQHQASEARLANMLEVAADAIIIIDENRRIITFNRGAEMIFGYEAQEVIGQTLDILLPISVIEAHKQHIQGFAQDDDEDHWTMGNTRPTIAGRHKEGHEFPIEASIAKLIQDGQVTFTAIVRDITQRKRTEKALLLQHHLAMTLSSTSDIQTALTSMVETTVQLEGIDGGAIRLINSESGELSVVTCSNICNQLITDTTKFNIEVIEVTTTAGHVPVFSYYFELTPRLNNLDQELKPQKILVIPVAFGGEVIAALILGSFSSAELPTSTHNMLQTITVLVGDVIARINAETALRISQERLNGIMQSLDDLIWSAHPTTLNFTYLSRAAENIYGRPGSEFIANPKLWFEAVHPDDRSYVASYNTMRFKLNKMNMEYRVIRPDGTIRWINERTWLIRDETGKPVRVDGIATDITDRKRAEAHLRQSEARNRAILNAIPDLLFQFNREGIVLDFNVKNEKDLYIPASQLLGNCVNNYLPPHVAQLTLDHIAQALDTGHIQQFQYQLPMSDGLRTFEARLTVTGRDETLAIIRDISEQAKLEQMKSDFINRASHELRTPLTTATMMVELIQEGGEPEELAEFWRILQMELRRQRELVEDLLTVGRLESGTLTLRPEPLNLGPVLSEAALAIAPLADTKQIQLITSEVPECLPMVNGDENGIRQVFINLVNNAVKFTPNYGNVCLKAASDESGVTVWVCDTGMGIPADDMPHLFERFFRASNATYYEVPGSGVGLYIVKSIIEALGGRITVDSVIEKGTTFAVWLPLSSS